MFLIFLFIIFLLDRLLKYVSCEFVSSSISVGLTEELKIHRLKDMRFSCVGPILG